jgi:hypothetical protein
VDEGARERAANRADALPNKGQAHRHDHLKATSFNFDDLDRSIRSIGEKDAASLIREKAGPPVPKDAAFPLDDAILKPILGTTAGHGTTEAMPATFSAACRAERSVSTGAIGICEITSAAAGNAASTPQSALRNDLSKQALAELGQNSRHHVGLFAHYA